MDNNEFLEDLESIVFIDPQNFISSKEWMVGSIGEAARMILACDKNKLSYILTGACCMNGNCELDGPIGASILCSTLRNLGYKTEVLTDSNAAIVVLMACMKCPLNILDSVEKIDRDLSFLVTIGRPSKCKNSNSYISQLGEDISDAVVKLDQLLETHINENPLSYKVISICDRLQECGAGNLDCIAKTENVALTLCDTLIMSGCCNWGGIALAAALIALTDSREAAQDFVELCGKQSEMVDKMIFQGSYDAVTGKQERTIEGLSFDVEHASVTHSIVTLIKQKFNL